MERDAIGSYDLVIFFPVESLQARANLMQSMIGQTWSPTGNYHSNPEAPFAPDWASLWGILINGLPSAPQSSNRRAI